MSSRRGGGRPTAASPALPPWRLLLLLWAAGGPLCGCVPGTVAPVAAGFGADVAILHRTLPDTIYSAITGRNCSMVRLDRGESYCEPVAPPVPPQPYCTRTLARIECWTTAAASRPITPPQVAQGPAALTPEQDRIRLARWPAALQ